MSRQIPIQYLHQAILGCMVGCLLVLPDTLPIGGSYTSVYPSFSGAIAIFSALYFISKFVVKRLYPVVGLGFLSLLSSIVALYFLYIPAGFLLLGAAFGAVFSTITLPQKFNIFAILGLTIGFVLGQVGLHLYTILAIISGGYVATVLLNRKTVLSTHSPTSFQGFYSAFLNTWPHVIHSAILYTILLWSMASIGVDEPLWCIYAGPIILILIFALQHLPTKRWALSDTMPFWVSVLLCLSIGYFYFIHGLLFILSFVAFWWILSVHYNTVFGKVSADAIIMILGLYSAFLILRTFDLITTIEALDMPAGLVPVAVRQFVIKDVAIMAAALIIYEGVRYVRHYMSKHKT